MIKQKKQLKQRRFAALLLALFMLFTLATSEGPFVPTAFALSQSDIDALKKDKSALVSQRKDVESQLSKLKDNVNTAMQRVKLLDDQIALTEKEIANTEQQIAGYNEMLEQIAAELEQNREDEARQYALFCERARIMEEAGSTSYWSVLFKAADFSDLLSRLSDVEEVMNYDQAVLDSLRRLRSGIEAKQDYQELLKAEAEEAKADLEQSKANLSAQRKEASDLVAKLQADVAAQEMLLKEREAAEAAIQQEIKKKEKELADQMAAASMDWTATSGGYIWPETVSKKINSPMGSRNTGIKGASTNHKGVDIGGVGTSTKVLATKAGIVTISQYSSSYGNYVVIQHGPGNTTLYAHMSSRSVSAGDTVKQGQVIGVTGSTGISSGPHLHYEITEGGSRVNPLNYLPGYIKNW